LYFRVAWLRTRFHTFRLGNGANLGLIGLIGSLQAKKGQSVADWGWSIRPSLAKAARALQHSNLR
jgi:hypothetical protein